MKKCKNMLTMLLCLLASFAFVLAGCSMHSGGSSDSGSDDTTPASGSVVDSDDGSGSGSGSGNSSGTIEGTGTDSGTITLTAPEAAGAVTLVADSAPSTELYTGTSVQKALEYLMDNSSTGEYTISVESGTYNELLFYTGSATITIEGKGTAEYGTDVVITYANSGNSNAMADLASGRGVTSGYMRGATRFDGSCTLILKNVTIQNSYSRSSNDGSSTQAEALVFSSTGKLIAYNSSFLSHQDTLYLGNKGGRMWFYKDYIAGDVDFIWGYMDVALFEECSIYCRGDETTKAYIFASRAIDTDAVNKGIVLLNNKIEIGSNVTAWYGRNSGSDTQAAILNSTITGAGSLNANLYQSAPGKYVLDAAGDLAIGYKDYNNTFNGAPVDTSSRLALCGALSERVANREYNGRYVILNRGYSEADEVYATGEVWDISAYESEFGATDDTSSANVYVDPVYAKNVIGGETVQLTPSSDVEGLSYTYASSDTTIATVSDTGLVTALTGVSGSAKITVTASNGSSDYMTIVVIDEEIAVTGISVSLASASVVKYGITTATVSFTPADATYQEYTLTSSDSSIKFFDPTTQKLADSVTATGTDGTSEISVWVGGDVSGATLTATSTSATSVSNTASVSTTAGAATWGDACAWRMATDIQSGNYGIFDGLVIDSNKSNSTLITDTSNSGKMSLKTNSKMQTRNVILYIPVEGASTVKINLASGSTGCNYYVGESSSNAFTANSDNTVWSYTYDGGTTGIVLGSAISGLGKATKAVGSIDNNGKYLRVVIARTSSDVYISSIDVQKTGDFTASFEEETAGATATWDFKTMAASAVSIQQGSTGTVESNVTGVVLSVDATSGKLQTRGSDAQFNTGAIIKVPVFSGSVVTVVSYPNYHNYTVAGVAADADTTTYTATDSDVATGYIEIVATSTAYLYSISVTGMTEE